MKLCDLNPHLRFASQIKYQTSDYPVKVRDCRIFYTVNGKADIFIENQHYQLSPGSLMYCACGSQYNILSPENFSLVSLNFDLTQENNSWILPYAPVSLTKKEPDFPISFQPVEDSDFLNSHLFLQDGSRFYRYIEKILKAFNGNSLYFREISSSVLKELLIDLHCQIKVPARSTVDFIMNYIDENYEKDLTKKDLATLAGYHEYYLNRLFLSSTGSSLHGYLLKVRLTRAAHLILNTDLALQDIPERVGFNSYPHFSSYFHKQFGVSPTQYRKSLKNRI